jgi:hypothetical protein
MCSYCGTWNIDKFNCFMCEKIKKNEIQIRIEIILEKDTGNERGK